mmetsp:Transcript_56173/g.134693  ORF Transcript_56173/g.134693 Transcript_56173/m.134693 type:complete len:276 (-) Transcript_56173:784-1611(-)
MRRRRAKRCHAARTHALLTRSGAVRANLHRRALCQLVGTRTSQQLQPIRRVRRRLCRPRCGQRRGGRRLRCPQRRRRRLRHRNRASLCVVFEVAWPRKPALRARLRRRTRAREAVHVPQPQLRLLSRNRRRRSRCHRWRDVLGEHKGPSRKVRGRQPVRIVLILRLAARSGGGGCACDAVEDAAQPAPHVRTLERRLAAAATRRLRHILVRHHPAVGSGHQDVCSRYAAVGSHSADACSREATRCSRGAGAALRAHLGRRVGAQRPVLGRLDLVR